MSIAAQDERPMERVRSRAETRRMTACDVTWWNPNR